MGIYSNINVSVGKTINTLGGIVALKGYQPRQLVDGDTVVVTGLDEGVDGQGSVYVWSEGSTAVPDNFQTVQPVFVIGKGRWLRLFNGVNSVVNQTLPAMATDAATTMALANAIRALLIEYGLAK